MIRRSSSYVMPNVIKEWHLSPVVAGSVVSYGLIGLMIGTAGLGMLADRIGRKIPLILGLVMFSVFNGGLFWVHNFKTFCILRFLAGIGMGGALTLNITLASEFAPARVRARMVAIMFIGFMIGPALARAVSRCCSSPRTGGGSCSFLRFCPSSSSPFSTISCRNRCVSSPRRAATTRPSASSEGWKRPPTSRP